MANQSKGLVLQWKGSRFYIDPILLLVTLTLVLFGYVMVASASLHLGDKMAGDSFYFPRHQLIHIFLGLILGVAAASVKLEYWQEISFKLFFVGLVLLVIVLVPGVGKSVNGSVRWLNILGVRIQVSEIFKLISVIYMSSFIDRHINVVRSSWTGIAKPFFLLSVGAMLLLKEPDFGSVVVIFAVASGMLLLAGAKFWHFGLLVGMFVMAGVMLVVTAPYRLRRVLSFLDPWDDPLNSDFQLSQALIAFGRGEWTGVGLGSSIQKLFYLPEAHTDFLFSVVGEELGLFGTTSVILLFMALVWRSFVIGRMAEQSGTRFSAFLAYGIGVWFSVQAFINMGVNMGLLPTKGLTLPLMSYGGGSIMIMSGTLALLFRVRSDAVAAVTAKPRLRATWANV